MTAYGAKRAPTYRLVTELPSHTSTILRLNTTVRNDVGVPFGADAAHPFPFSLNAAARAFARYLIIIRWRADRLSALALLSERRPA